MILLAFVDRALKSRTQLFPQPIDSASKEARHAVARKTPVQLAAEVLILLL